MRNTIVLVVYLGLMATIAAGMFRARDWASGSLDNTVATDEWQKFREEVVDMNEASPVQRRVPKSNEPPALVLLRDHFAACTTIALVLSTALYATCAFFAIGILSDDRPQAEKVEQG